MTKKRDPRIHREQDEKLIIIGASDQVVPEALLFNSEDNLSEDARVWAIIKKFAVSGKDMPTQNELAELIGKSRPTVNMSLQMLRVNRWVTIIQEEDRNQKGQFNRLTYAIHSHQMPLESTLMYDPGYLEFLKSKSNGSVDRIRQRAIKVLEQVQGYLANDREQLIISHGKNSVIISNEPCKNFLHGKHVSTTSTTTSFLDTTITTEAGPNNPGYKNPHEPDSEYSVSKTFKDSDSVTPGYKNPHEPDSEYSAEDSNFELHQYFKRLPQSVHKVLLRCLMEHQLPTDQEITLMRILVKRYEDDTMRPVQHLPSYIQKLFKKASTNELYDSDAEKRKTKERRKVAANENLDKAMVKRGAVVGLSLNDGESMADFEERIIKAEWAKSMANYGMAVDPETGFVVEKN